MMLSRLIFISCFVCLFSTVYPKNAIVIGASTGIGRGIAQLLMKTGEYAHIGIAARRTSLLDQLVATSKPETKIHVIEMDVSKPEQAQEQFRTLVAAMGGTLDLVILNAGTWQDAGFLHGNRSFDWQKEKGTLSVNVMGFTALANVALNQFIKQGYGHLVGISSIDAIRGKPAATVYAATKAFVSTYLEGMRSKFSILDIPINITDIRPGFVAVDNPALDNNEEKEYWAPVEYWTASIEDAAQEIYEAIKEKKSYTYVTKRWWFIAALTHVMPDFLYNRLSFLNFAPEPTA